MQRVRSLLWISTHLGAHNPQSTTCIVFKHAIGMGNKIIITLGNKNHNYCRHENETHEQTDIARGIKHKTVQRQRHTKTDRDTQRETVIAINNWSLSADKDMCERSIHHCVHKYTCRYEVHTHVVPGSTWGGHMHTRRARIHLRWSHTHTRRARIHLRWSHAHT